MNIFYGKSIKGNIVWDNNKALMEYLVSVEGKSLTIKIDREKTVRSHNQNSYYWFYLRLIANDTGHSEDELHQLFKRIFLPPEFKTILGTEVKIPRTTKNLSKWEFGQYLDKICAKTGVPLPDVKQVTDLLDENIQYPQEELKPKF